MDWTKLLESNPVQKLKELTSKPREDKRPARQRAKLLQSLAAARAQHAAGEEAPKHSIYKKVGDYARVELRAGRTKLPLAGNEFGLVPWERFPDFIDGVTAHVEGGGFDAEILASLGAAQPNTRGKETTKRRGPMNPDVVARRNATRAANKTKREAEKANSGQGAPA